MSRELNTAVQEKYFRIQQLLGHLLVRDLFPKGHSTQVGTVLLGRSTGNDLDLDVGTNVQQVSPLCVGVDRHATLCDECHDGIDPRTFLGRCEGLPKPRGIRFKQRLAHLA